MNAVILGGARCLAADLAAARDLFKPKLVIATNHAGMDHRGPVHHWVTYHPELFPEWIAKRRKAGLPDALTLWSSANRKIPDGLDVRLIPRIGGSSGLLAAFVALEIGCKGVLCGVPMDPREAHYDQQGLWRAAVNCRQAWMNAKPKIAASIRSMSGWTADLLGRPTKAWLHG